MDQKFIEKQKEKLEEQKISAQKELEKFAKKDNVPEGDWETKYPNREEGDKEEEADEVQEYENLLALEHSLELRLKDINDALNKIAEGKYGICEKCGKEIESERLEAVPEAKLCIKDNK
jgi:RNA polymerase-binding transcription factor DksA